MTEEQVASRVMNAGDLRTIQRVYRDIIAKPWFTSSPADRRAFGATLIRAYLRGTRDETELRAYGLALAEERYRCSSER